MVTQSGQVRRARTVASPRTSTYCTAKTGITYFFIKDPSGILVEFLEDKRSF